MNSFDILAEAETLDSLTALSVGIKSPKTSRFKHSTTVPLQIITPPEDVSTELKGTNSTAPLQRFRRGQLSVTDLVAPKWCEIQYEYHMEQGGKKETAAMARGKSIHLALELEVHDIKPVTIKSKEDRWGLRIINLVMSLETLLTSGIAREVPVFGIMNGLYISGVIDEVRRVLSNADTIAQRDNPSRLDHYFQSSSPPIEEYDWLISDTKTRISPNLPADSQSAMSKMQIMIYKRMWDTMVQDAKRAKWSEADSRLVLPETDQDRDSSIFTAALFDSLQLDIRKEFSQEFTVDTALVGDSAPKNIAQLLLMLRASLLMAETASDELEISYRWQGKEIEQVDTPKRKRRKKAGPTGWGDLIGTEKFKYDADACNTWLQTVGGYWRGERRPIGVSVHEANWKCDRCEFRENCWWREEKAREHLEAVRARRSQVK